MSDSSETVQEKLYEKLIRIVPDFPKPGVQFVDWMPVCADNKAFMQMLYDMIDMVKEYHFTKLAGLESRGFMLGIPMAILMGLDFVPVIGKREKSTRKVQKNLYRTNLNRFLEPV